MGEHELERAPGVREAVQQHRKTGGISLLGAGTPYLGGDLNRLDDRSYRATTVLAERIPGKAKPSPGGRASGPCSSAVTAAPLRCPSLTRYELAQGTSGALERPRKASMLSMSWA